MQRNWWYGQHGPFLWIDINGTDGIDHYHQFLSHQYPTRSHSTKLPKTAFLSILCQLLSEYAVRCWDGIWSVEWSATEWWTFFKAPLSVHTAIFFNVKYTIFKHNLEWWTFFKAPFSLHTTSFFNVKCTIFKHTLQAFQWTSTLQYSFWYCQQHPNW